MDDVSWWVKIVRRKYLRNHIFVGKLLILLILGKVFWMLVLYSSLIFVGLLAMVKTLNFGLKVGCFGIFLVAEIGNQFWQTYVKLSKKSILINYLFIGYLTLMPQSRKMAWLLLDSLFVASVKVDVLFLSLKLYCTT